MWLDLLDIIMAVIIFTTIVTIYFSIGPDKQQGRKYIIILGVIFALLVGAVLSYGEDRIPTPKKTYGKDLVRYVLIYKANHREMAILDPSINIDNLIEPAYSCYIKVNDDEVLFRLTDPRIGEIEVSYDDGVNPMKYSITEYIRLGYTNVKKRCKPKTK